MTIAPAYCQPVRYSTSDIFAWSDAKEATSGNPK